MRTELAQLDVTGKPPVPLLHSGLLISPRTVKAQYWCDGAWELGDVAVYGPRVEDGRPGPIHCKTTYWTDTLHTAPQWVQEFVNDRMPTEVEDDKA